MNEDGNRHKLEQRIARLEQKVEELEKALSQQKSQGKGINNSESDSETRRNSKIKVSFQKEEPVREEIGYLQKQLSIGENWLNWLGIGLLLLGVVFLFKYSIDQGWLIPPIRSATGLAIGFGLLGSGFVSKSYTTLRQILLGGGIAAFYITGFATFQLYSFMSYQIVWTFMVGVTLLALYLASIHEEAILSVLGTVGGLATPFLLYTGQGSLLMLILYTCLILSGSGIMYMMKGWKSLLWATVTGGWVVLVVGWAVNIYNELNPDIFDRWILQLGALFSVLVFWIVPVIRELLRFQDPDRWAVAQKGGQRKKRSPSFVADSTVQGLTVTIPTALLFYSYSIWSLPNEFWGGMALVGSLIVGYSYLYLHRKGLKKLSMSHGFSALVLITISLFLLLEGQLLLTALGLEALGLRIIASKSGDENLSFSSHLLFGFIGVWIIDRLLMTGSEIPLFNLNALTELLIIGIAGLMVPNYLEEETGKTNLVYQLGAHIALLGWFLRELSVLDDGQAYVTVAWGIYALAILFIGFWHRNTGTRLLGMATVFAVVAKLFLVDLTQINTLLRILLFIGFGLVFLVVGYTLQKKWGHSLDKEHD